MSQLRPMRAEKASLQDFRYPLIGSPKLDGIRALAKDGQPLSRTLKVIPNRFVQRCFSEAADALQGLDGELIVGDPWGHDVYRRTDSAVMTHSGEPNFHYYVFDRWDVTAIPYKERLGTVRRKANQYPSWVRILDAETINNQEELLAYEEGCLTMGYEGLMLRKPEGRYKYGKSTLNEGYLMKFKRFVDTEAEIVGFTELMRNDNEAEINELGLTKRSKVSANMTPMGVLGNFIVRGAEVGNPFYGVVFEVGSGLTAAEKAKFWKERDSLLGKIIKVKYFERGVLDKPRFPVYLGFRSAAEM